MKIGIDARFWNESGVGRYIRNLVFFLQQIDKKNKYILFTYKNGKIRITNPNWKIVDTDIHWHSLEEQIKFPKLINEQNLDLMHFPYFSIPILYTKPYIVTIHDLILHHFSTGEASTKPLYVYKLKRLFYKYIIKKASQDSKKVITVSESTKKEILKLLNIRPDKIIVTYEGIDTKLNTSSHSSKINKDLEILINKKYFLHVGNLYPHKNINFVIDSIHKIKTQNNIKIHLVIAGKKDYFNKKIQQKVNKLNLQKQIIFLGEVSDSELSYLFNNTLALISPSLMEGFDLPVLESMKSRCLVLASDIPVHREICQDSALYFGLKNEKDLISKLIEIHKNGKEKYLDKIIKAESIANNFSWEKMASDTLKVYESCTGLR